MSIKHFELLKYLKSIIILILTFVVLLAHINVAKANEYEDNFFELEDNFNYNSKSTNIYDPLEKLNRKIFYFNEKADKYFMKPVNTAYRFITPNIFRKSINNILSNLSHPFDVINSLIQGDISNSRASFSSFLINSTVGLFGIFDIAKSKNINFKKNSFADTLAHYGISRGPYLVLPFLGPSDVRNFSGLLVEKTVDPLSINMLKAGGKNKLIKDKHSYGLTTINAINKYDQIADILHSAQKDSFDLYSVMRSVYLQSKK